MDNTLPKKKRSEAMIKAQKKYYEKIKNEQPEVYSARNKKYAKIQYERNKQKPDFAENNRKNVKAYYYRNKEVISQKRKDYYNNNKQEILQRQKLLREARNVDNNNIIQ